MKLKKSQTVVNMTTLMEGIGSVDSLSNTVRDINTFRHVSLEPDRNNSDHT